MQECLTNVHRHSDSPNALVKLVRTPTEITLEVKDDGKGINEDARSNIVAGAGVGVGFRGMQERVRLLGGTLTVNAVGGIATFSDITVSATGAYTLTASDAALTPATSSSFLATPIVYTPAEVAFAQQPSATYVGSVIAPAMSSSPPQAPRPRAATADHPPPRRPSPTPRPSCPPGCKGWISARRAASAAG